MHTNTYEHIHRCAYAQLHTYTYTHTHTYAHNDSHLVLYTVLLMYRRIAVWIYIRSAVYVWHHIGVLPCCSVGVSMYRRCETDVYNEKQKQGGLCFPGGCCLLGRSGQDTPCTRPHARPRAFDVARVTRFREHRAVPLGAHVHPSPGHGRLETGLPRLRDLLLRRAAVPVLRRALLIGCFWKPRQRRKTTLRWSAASSRNEAQTCRSTLFRPGPTSAEIARIWPKPAEVGPTPFGIWPTSLKWVKSRLDSAKCRPTPVKIAWSRPRWVGRFGPTVCQHRPTLGQLRPASANFGWDRPKFGRNLG